MIKNPIVANSSRPITGVVLLTEEIKRRRLALGLTKADAARRAGFQSSQHWWNIENGYQPDIRASTLAAVAKALGCKMDDLFSGAPTTRKTRRK